MSDELKRLARLPFTLPQPSANLHAFRVCLAIVAATWLIAGPFTDFYAAENGLLYRPTGAAAVIPPLGREAFEALRGFALISCIAMLVPYFAQAGTMALSVLFFVLNGYVSGFGPLWNYNTHLNFFLVALSFWSPRSPDNEQKLSRESAILFAIRLQVALVYLQAGLAKLLHGGIWWAIGTPYVHLVLQNADSQSILAQAPWLVATLSYLVIIGELVLAPMFLHRRTQLAAVVGATALHLSFYVFLGIAFWHLWVLYPAIFLNGRQLRSFSPNL